MFGGGEGVWCGEVGVFGREGEVFGGEREVLGGGVLGGGVLGEGGEGRDTSPLLNFLRPPRHTRRDQEDWAVVNGEGVRTARRAELAVCVCERERVSECVCVYVCVYV